MANFIHSLPDRLDPRKLRLLVAAQCRDLWVEACRTAQSEGYSTDHIRSMVDEALEASDRFADTGKTKTAMSQALKRVEGGNWSENLAMSELSLLLRALLAQEPSRTVKVLDLMHLRTSLRRQVPPDVVLAQIRFWVEDLSPPPGDAGAIEPACRTTEVRELAQSIYRQLEFERMPELADLLERAGCSNQTVLEHCRSSAPHIRGCWALDEIMGAETMTVKPAPATGLKRHQILNRELHSTQEFFLKCVHQAEPTYRERTQPGKPNQQFARQLYLDDCMMIAVAEHLGYGPIPDLSGRLNRGVDAALEYFFGDWWKANEEDAKALDKSRADRELNWLSIMPYGLILCGLTGRWDDAVRLCSWIDESIQLEHRFEMNDYEYQWLNLCIFSELGGRPLPGSDEVMKQLRECRPKHPRMMASAWDAVRANDAKAYASALKESVKNYLNVHARDVGNMNFWVSLPDTMIWLIAEHRGMSFPKLPDKSDAAVVRRQTIGIAPIVPRL